MINHNMMRKENVLHVLQCIQERGPIYRKDVRKVTGLSVGSVSTIIQELIEQGYIVELVDENEQRGRNPGMLDIMTSNHCIIGIDINSAGISIAQMNLKCEINSSFFEKIEKPDRTSILQQIYRMLDGIVEDLEKREVQLLGIGVAMQGTVDRENGISVYSAYFSDWKDVPIKRLFEERYKCMVSVEHSPDCMASYENWFGVAKGVENFLFIRVGSTIGMSIVFGGNAIHGADHNAGEFGHIIMEPDGEVCSCGGRGCLETVASTESVRKYVYREIMKGRETSLNRHNSIRSLNDVTMEMIYVAWCAGDALCVEAMNRMAYYLGLGIANMINLLNPELIVLGGSAISYESAFLPRVREVVRERAWAKSSKSVITSMNKTNTASIGGGLNIIKQVIFRSQIPEAETS